MDICGPVNVDGRVDVYGRGARVEGCGVDVYGGVDRCGGVDVCVRVNVGGRVNVRSGNVSMCTDKWIRLDM